MTFADRLVETWYAHRLTPLALALWPLSLAFRAVVAVRRFLYRCGILRSVRLAVPVIVVGNITAGGSGKTPLVAALAAALKQRGYRPGIVSRGYGRRESDADRPLRVSPDDDPDRVGDEPLLLARAGFPVVVARDRVAAGRALLASNAGCNVVLADDGLQHYRLARDVEIAVVDTARMLGNELSLPAGPLREPWSRLAAVDAVVALVAAGEGIPQLLANAYTMMLVGHLFVRVDNPLARASASYFIGEGIHAVAGIGNPSRFFDQLAAMGIVATTHAFPDHHRFVAADLRFDNAEAILMTEKDALKCESFADDRYWSLPVRAQIDEALIALIEERLHG